MPKFSFRRKSFHWKTALLTVTFDIRRRHNNVHRIILSGAKLLYDSLKYSPGGKRRGSNWLKHQPTASLKRKEKILIVHYIVSPVHYVIL